MDKMLEKMRKLNWLLQKSGEGTIPFNELCEILSDLMLSNVYVTSRKGKILGVHYAVKKDTVAKIDPDTGKEYINEKTNEGLLGIESTVINLTMEEAERIFFEDPSAYNKYTMIVPIFGGGRRVGTLTFSRYDQEYDTSDIILAEYGSAVVGIDMERRQNREVENEIRKRAVVQLAIGNLSYTEIDAVKHILEHINGVEGLVITSKVAEATGITRSVILNGLKKLESAGVIESKSLGMKGTHLRIVNDQLKTELSRVEV